MVGQKIWLKCTDGNSYSYVNLCRLLCRCTTLTQQIEKTKAEHSQYVEVNLSTSSSVTNLRSLKGDITVSLRSCKRHNPLSMGFRNVPILLERVPQQFLRQV
ncbi:hypothetical protein RB195_019686 [Necator americanus]|uniref:Phlebovirus glycoprotein G2 fusion domain-containing protein n=1 Tax=Necator americanus TaxID=51031 RepID=A0ABR1CHA6_NECAM